VLKRCRHPALPSAFARPNLNSLTLVPHYRVNALQNLPFPSETSLAIASVSTFHLRQPAIEL
jgi:hypothetical protein